LYLQVTDNTYNPDKAKELIENVYPEGARADMIEGMDKCFEEHGI